MFDQPLGGALSLRLPSLRPWARKVTAEERTQTFERLVAQDWDRFHRFAVHLCNGNRDDAEDLLADSMTDAFRSFDRFRGDGFDRWFFRILSHNRIDMVRRQKVRKTQSLDALQGTDGGPARPEVADERTPGPESQVINACYSEPVQAALDELTEEYRTVVLLCDVEGMDYQSIADILGIPIGTVRSRLARGRDRLRAKLAPLQTST